MYKYELLANLVHIQTRLAQYIVSDNPEQKQRHFDAACRTLAYIVNRLNNPPVLDNAPPDTCPDVLLA